MNPSEDSNPKHSAKTVTTAATNTKIIETPSTDDGETERYNGELAAAASATSINSIDSQKVQIDHPQQSEEVRDRQRRTSYLQHPSVAINVDSTSSSSSNSSLSSSDMKRSAVKDLIERYFYQLQRGCGNVNCTNINCASSGMVAPMSANETAAKAIQLFSQDAKLCDTYNQPPKVSRTQLDAPSCSRSVMNSSHYDTDMPSPEENSNTSSSSSAQSTITSENSNSGRSATMTTPTSTNTNISSCDTEEAAIMALPELNLEVPKPSTGDTEEDTCNSVYPDYVMRPIEFLNEEIVDALIDDCEKTNNYEYLFNAINEVFWSVEKLSVSFLRNPKLTNKDAKLHEILDKPLEDLKKEDIRTLQGEIDKDVDSTCASEIKQTDDEDDAVMDDDFSSDILSLEGSDTLVDLESLRRVKKKIFGLNNVGITEAVNSNIVLLAESVKYRNTTEWEPIIHCLIICFDMATNSSNSFADMEYLERSLPKLCSAARYLPPSAQARIARIWAAHCKDQLQSLIQSCQQLITLQVILDEDTVQENPDVITVTKVLKIAFYANLLAGKLDPPPNPCLKANDSNIKASSIDAGGDGPATSSGTSHISASTDDDDFFVYSQVAKPHYTKFAEDSLAEELNISIYDCRVPYMPFVDFYNEPLSEAIQMDRDYLNYKNLSIIPKNDDMGDANFSFMLYSFILTPASKVIALYYDSRIRMYSERSSSLYSLLHYFGDNNSETDGRPDLKLKVRRDQLINDALIGLELVAMSNPKDLKKQLVVEFVGEQGIDEGGVSKEFFQLIVEEIFNPDFGMFVQQEETNTVWFNSSPFENEAQFTLIGIIIGLAIYNNVILAVNFPMVVYRKLMGCPGTFFDLENWNPTLYRSLKSMLDYKDDDFEDVFMTTFKITYKDMFGEIVEHELQPGGGDISVTQENKQDFVDLYTDFLLNKSIQRQFAAFKKGFEMVTDESPLKLLFRPEEIELLVCGSRKFDFFELEKSTEYEGGYTEETGVIVNFWSIVHALPEESKRKLLEFTTGSDRVPVGGLSRLKLLITRHGPDSDRLPTSHTCYNVLLLPEYTTKEKLEERLLKAINYSKGFGML